MPLIDPTVGKTPEQLEALERANRAIESYHASLRGDPLASYSTFLKTIFPKYMYRPLADFHHNFWQHLWDIQEDKRPRPYIACWFRASGKSALGEIGSIALGARKVRRYGLYVHAIQNKANDHLLNIRGMLEDPKLARYFPSLSRPQVGEQTSHMKGWKMNRLWTAGDLIIDAYGLDAGLRGARLGETRPDFIFLDDLDEDRDSIGMVEKKIEMITKKILPAGDIQRMAVFFMQTLTHRESIMYRLIYGDADFLQDRIVSMGAPLPILTNHKIERKIDPVDQKGKWIITRGTPRWPSMTLEECQGLLNSWGYKSFQTEGLQNVDAPYEGAIFPAFDPVYHVITYSDFMRVYRNQMKWHYGVMRGREDNPIFALPQHGHKYFAQDVGTTPGHPAVTLWAYQPGEGMPCSDSLIVYREMCRPKFPMTDENELVSPLRLGMEIQDLESANEEKIQWRIGSHEQAITRNSYEVDLPLVQIPGEYDNNGKPAYYKAMEVDPINTTEKGNGISTVQDLLIVDAGIPHPFTLHPETGKPLDGCPRIFFLVPDDQGGKFIDPNGEIRCNAGYDERGFNRTRWEFPKYRHRISASGEELTTTRKIDDDAMDALIALCARAQRTMQQMPKRAKAIQALDPILHPDVIHLNPNEMAYASQDYWIKAHALQADNNSHYMKKLKGFGK